MTSYDFQVTSGQRRICVGQLHFLILIVVLAGSYGGYDWGSEEKNLLHHGSPAPPSYSLKNVTAKVSPTFFARKFLSNRLPLCGGTMMS